MNWESSDFSQGWRSTATTVPLAAQNGVSGISAGGNFSLALKGNSVIVWGDTSEGQIPADWGNATTVAAGGAIASVVTQSGYASDWGSTGPGGRVLVTLSFVGSGAGSINSVPSGLSCTSGLCMSAFDSGTPITLVPASSTGSHFSGWTSGPCTGTGECSWPLSSNLLVAASFDLDNGRARVLESGTVYQLISQAYAAALNGNTIQVVKGPIAEDLVFDGVKRIVLKGGYDNSFGGQTDKTSITGTMKISNGAVAVERVGVGSP